MSGLAERWQRSDQNSPLSQVTIHDGNQLTVIPIVGWTCRAGAISVDLTLYHNAFDTPTQPFPPPPAAPPLGNGWRHSYMASLSQDMMTGNVTVTEGDGRKHLFTKNPDGSYTRPAGVFETLVKNPDASFRLTRKDQVKWNFGSAGKLTSIVELNNNSISLSYDGSGRVSSLADPSGRTLNFTYDGSGFLTSVTDPLNRVFTFSYTGTPQSLWKVNEPSPSTFFLQFGYDGTKKVTSVKDKRGNVWTFNYEPTTRRLTYVTDPASKTRNYSYPTSSRTTVQDENGNSVTYVFGSSGQVTAIDRFPIPMGQPLTESFTYDSNFNVTQQTKPSGSIWEFT
ncbi:MAG: RHS repeat protein, partial [Planctomycetes bacterium]|nr:RHS repeat protein [Planctomycetota bacterium]